MMFTAEIIQAALAPRPVRFYPQVNSTNDLALEWLLDGAPPGSTVIADEQVKGRGRLGRSWYAPPGTALILSVILHPKPEYLSLITMLGALSVYDLLRHSGAEAIGIKWPNDVQLNGRKVCGILPEAVWDGSKLRGIVLGMGVNVSIDFTGTELAKTAISIQSALGQSLDRLELLGNLLTGLDDWCEQIEDVFAVWKDRLTTLGQMVTYQGVTGKVRGIALDVDPQGALLVQDGAGGIQRLVAGDIALGSEA